LNEQLVARKRGRRSLSGGSVAFRKKGKKRGKRCRRGKGGTTEGKNRKRKKKMVSIALQARCREKGGKPEKSHCVRRIEKYLKKKLGGKLPEAFLR